MLVKMLKYSKKGEQCDNSRFIRNKLLSVYLLVNFYSFFISLESSIKLKQVFFFKNSASLIVKTSLIAHIM